MLLNEEQAKKLVCHRTRNTVLAGGDDRPCLGSKCMAWEWKKYGVIMIDGNRTGYCRDLPGSLEE